MTTKIDNSQRAASKIAGWTYLISFAIVVFANYVLLGPLIIPRNAVDTAHNIVAHQTQFRIALTLFLTYSIGAVILAAALYIILKPINHYLALLGAFFRLVFAMSWLLSAIDSLGALRLLVSTRTWKCLNRTGCRRWRGVTIASTFDDYYVGLPFFGLSATASAWLWLKSNYIPRGLSIFGVIASAWCVLCAVVYLIFPDFNKIVNDYIFDTPMALFELVVSFWLVFKGLKPVASLPAQTGVV
jgi:hypothetical protein